MIHHVWSRIASPVPLAAALLTLACHPGVLPRGMPLYANASATLPPRAAVAQLIGPIGTVDGRDVFEQGGVFELLPGCHVVELDRRPLNSANNSVAGSVYVSGQFPLITYAIRMKAGASYVIRRDLPASGMGDMVRLQLSAQEEDANGKVTELNPTQSADEIHACNQ
jgi:hypothetical protein